MGEAVARETAMTSVASIITKTTNKDGKVRIIVNLTIIVIEANNFKTHHTKTTISTRMIHRTKATTTIIKETSETRTIKGITLIIKEATTRTTKDSTTKTASTMTIVVLLLEAETKEIRTILTISIIKTKPTILIEETSIMAMIGREEDKITVKIVSIIGETTTTVKTISSTIRINIKMFPISMNINSNGIKSSNNFNNQISIDLSKAAITMLSKEMIEDHLKTTTTIATLTIIAIIIKISTEIVEISTKEGVPKEGNTENTPIETRWSKKKLLKKNSYKN